MGVGASEPEAGDRGPHDRIDAHCDLMARAARAAALREIVSLMAHELHQPLASISASGEAALRWLDRPEPAIAEAMASLTRVIDHKDRAADIIARLRLTLAAAPDPQPTSLREALDRAITALGVNRAGSLIDLVMEGPPVPELVAIAPIEAELLFHHLLRNALEAMALCERKTVKINFSANEGRVVIDIRDAGVGVAEAARSHLFEPFFSTKPGAEGLGLSICRSIVRGVDGRLELRASDANGSTFRAELPVAEGAAKPG